MEEQLRRQAPDGAVGYRLVLPLRSGEEWPRHSPPLFPNGQQTSWRLSPFEAPDDIRLVDGQVYRVLWVDEGGRLLTPRPERPLPGLRFFLDLVEGAHDPVPEVKRTRQRSAIALRAASAEVKQRSEATRQPLVEQAGSPAPERAEQASDEALPAAVATEKVSGETKENPPISALRVAQEVIALDQLQVAQIQKRAETTWTPGSEWLAAVQAKPVWEALQQLEKVFSLSPDLMQSAAALDDKGRASFTRFRSHLFDEVLSASAELASQKLAESLSKITTEQLKQMFSKTVFLLLDRWDALLGLTKSAQPPKESLSLLSAELLRRVRSAFLLYLAAHGVRPELPLGQTFDGTRHHRHAVRDQPKVLSGRIIEVTRAGYLRGAEVVRRAQVVVVK